MSEHTDASKPMESAVKGMRFPVVTTIDRAGRLTSRPLTCASVEQDRVWFLVDRSASWTSDLPEHPQVNLAFSDSDDGRYVTASGHAVLDTDRSRIDGLWNPGAEAFFPNGKDDPNVAALMVTVDEGEYWDGPSTSVGKVAALVSTWIHRDPSRSGEHGRLAT